MGIDRRGVLRGLAGAVGAVLGLEGAEWDVLPAGGLPRLTLLQMPTLTKAIYRRADQMSVRLEFYNLTLLKKGQPGPGDQQQARLVKVDPLAEAFIVVDFGPQHLAEHAYDEVTNEPVIVPTKSILAGASRLAFRVPTTPIPYTFGTLMTWKDLLPSLAPHATGPATVSAPEPVHTAIEVPWKVVLSPDQAGTWSHPMVPVPGPGGRSVLWHARLNPGAKARVIWTPDPANSTPLSQDPNPPGVTSMQPYDRSRLVKLTSRWDLFTGGQTYTPKPIDVEQLALSSFGAWLKSEGKWEVRPDGVDLKEWVHLATMGRDHFVRLVDAGRLWGIGHRVDLIKISQRRTEMVGGKLTAVLRQWFQLIPRELERTYEAGDIPFAPFGLREMPFKKIRILTRSTPHLAPFEGPLVEPSTKIPKPSPPGAYYGRDAFWPRVGGPNNWADFLWELEGEDYEGRVTRFAMPLIHVSESFGASPGINNLKTYYETTIPEVRRTADLGGQKVALARFDGLENGEAAYPIKTFTFGVDVFLQGPVGHGVPWDFTPKLLHAGAMLDAVDRVRGGAATTPQKITLHKSWVEHGDTPSNPGRVFAALDSAVALSFGGNASGGVATPDMAINALSAITGPIDAPGVADTVTPSVPSEFKPADFFGGADPKVLGAISLIEILEAVAFPDPGGLSVTSTSSVPRLVTTEIEGGVRTSLSWETPVKKGIPHLFTNSMDGNEAKLTLDARADTFFDGSPPSTVVRGEITDFTIHAVLSFEVIDLLFNKFGFESRDGKKPDITVSIHDVEFKGALEFVNALRKFMGNSPIGGGGGGQAALAAVAAADEPPENGGYVNVSLDGVQAGYNLTLPPAACGALLLENISFGARADLFFDGRPMAIRFNFAERNRPFTLTVMCFGGGGFLALTLDLDGFELFEMSLEFGAKLALDIGVASGSISAMAGIYLAIGGTGTDTVRLTGYLRLNGELNILGIIRLAIEFYLAFTYISSPESCYGEAQVTVEIEVLFFSASVTLGPIKKTFAGGESDAAANGGQMAIKSGTKTGMQSGGQKALATSTPKTFTEMTLPAHWVEYAAMFDPAAF